VQTPTAPANGRQSHCSPGRQRALPRPDTSAPSWTPAAALLSYPREGILPPCELPEVLLRLTDTGQAIVMLEFGSLEVTDPARVTLVEPFPPLLRRALADALADAP
jgi:hypothetical protein